MTMRHHAQDEPPTIISMVFDQRRARTTPLVQLHWALPISVAFLLHALLWWIASSTELSLETWSARMATSIHQDLAIEAPVEVDPTLFKPPVKPPVKQPVDQPVVQQEPPPKIKPTPPPPSAEKKFKRTRRAASKRPPAPDKRSSPTPAQSTPRDSQPAQAGKIISTQSKDRVDLSDHVFIQGAGNAYVGGVTTAQGKGQTARSDLPIKRGERRVKKRVKSKARPVQLSARNWKCPWPREAVDQRIYQQTVVIKVIVTPQGGVDQVIVTEDPGFGFGEAAKKCALQTRFSPALNREGRPIRAISAPIKVRFSR